MQDMTNNVKLNYEKQRTQYFLNWAENENIMNSIRTVYESDKNQFCLLYNLKSNGS